MSKVRELHKRWLEDCKRSLGGFRFDFIHSALLMNAIVADEAEAAKARELPAEVRDAVETLRGLNTSYYKAASETISDWFDANYPKPKSQAEKDAEYLEDIASRHPYTELAAIAHRLRGGT